MDHCLIGRLFIFFTPGCGQYLLEGHIFPDVCYPFSTETFREQYLVGEKFTLLNVVAQSEDSSCFPHPTAGATFSKELVFQDVCYLLNAWAILQVASHGRKIFPILGRHLVKRLFAFSKPFCGRDHSKGRVFWDMCYPLTTWGILQAKSQDAKFSPAWVVT